LKAQKQPDNWLTPTGESNIKPVKRGVKAVQAVIAESAFRKQEFYGQKKQSVI
jgi:hypothetical protein